MMGLKNLSDDQLKQFVEDPNKFLRERENYRAVFDLDDKTLEKRLGHIRRSLGLPEREFPFRLEDAK